MPSDDCKLMLKLLTSSQLSKEDGLRVIRAVKETAQLDTPEVVAELTKQVETHLISQEDLSEGKKSGKIHGDPIVTFGKHV